MTPRPEAVRTAGTAPHVREGGRRPALEVVERRDRRRSARRRRLLPLLSAAMVSGALIAVVVGHAELAQGQLRLSSVQAALTRAEAAHRSAVVAVGQLENPARVASEAEVQLHMQAPAQVLQLPYVSLSTPLPAPTVAAAPATSGGAASSSATSGSPTTSTTSSTSPASTGASTTPNSPGQSAGG